MIFQKKKSTKLSTCEMVRVIIIARMMMITMIKEKEWFQFLWKIVVYSICLLFPSTTHWSTFRRSIPVLANPFVLKQNILSNGRSLIQSRQRTQRTQSRLNDLGGMRVDLFEQGSPPLGVISGCHQRLSHKKGFKNQI